MTITVEVEKLAKWGQPKKAQTKFGMRNVRTAAATQEFWSAWRADRDGMLALGLSCGKNDDGEWEIRWWLPTEEMAQVEAASHAVSTTAKIAAPLGIDYFPFQKAGIQFALDREGTYIGDEMGLGKTVQAIGVINADTSIKRVLIICPASLKLNWAKELRRWLVQSMPISLVSGQKGSLPDKGIVIMNYDLLSFREKQVTGEVWDLVVLDESHYIKSRDTIRAKVIAGVRAKAGEETQHPGIQARRRIAMTGTPIMNRPIEIFETLRWLNPQWNGGRSKFAQTYCGACEGNGWDVTGASNLPQLQAMLRQTVMVRRLKSEVLTELPAKQRTIVEFPTTADMRKVLEAELKEWDQKQVALKAAQAERDVAKQHKEDKELYNDAVSNLKEAMRVAFEQMAAVRAATAKVKLPSVIDFCTEALNDGGGKIVLMCHHHSMVDGLYAALQEFNPVKCDGRMSAGQKQESVDSFQADPSVKVFIGSIRAAGVGYTLTAASHVVFAELDWVPGVVTQAEDRCHRIGQKDSVLVQHLVLEHSLDARMAELIVQKQAIADKALDDKHEIVEAPQKTTIEIQVKEMKQIVNKSTVEAVEVPVIPQAKVEAAHQCMKLLAGVCDGANSMDDNGFSKVDTEFGHSLANRGFLSQKQAVWAIKFARKYKRQLPTHLKEILEIGK